MARKKQAPVDTGFVLFDVLYEDGSRSSNRKVPNAEIAEAGGDDQVRWLIEAQDRKIAEMSGQPRGPVKSVSRSPTR